MPVIVCPGCGARLRVDPQPSGKFACPKCNKVMRLASQASNEPGGNGPKPDPHSGSAPSGSQASSNQTSRNQAAQRPSSSGPATTGRTTSSSSATAEPFSTIGLDLPPVDGGGYMASSSGQYPNAGSSTYYGGSSNRSSGVPSDLKSFAKKLAIFIGIVATAIVASLPLTYTKSLLCLIPNLLVILSCIGTALWARIWLIVLGFAQSQTQGLMVIFVPYYWLFFVSKNKPLCMRPLLVLGSSLVPGLLGVIVTTFFKPDFVGSSSGTSLRLTSAQQAQAREVLTKATSNAKPGELLTAQFPIFLLTKPDASTLGERALSQLPGYVQGSFKISPDQKSLTLQYRGSDKKVAMHYAMVLPGEAGVMLGFEPTFTADN